jgi:hypothetical protein
MRARLGARLPATSADGGEVKRSTIRLAPHRATASGYNSAGRKAWWFENGGSIEIYIECGGAVPASARINRAALADWIKRTEPKPRADRKPRRRKG